MRFIYVQGREYPITEAAAEKFIALRTLFKSEDPQRDLEFAKNHYYARVQVEDLLDAVVRGWMIDIGSVILEEAELEPDTVKRHKIDVASAADHKIVSSTEWLKYSSKIEAPADVLKAAIKRAHDNQHEHLAIATRKANSTIREAIEAACKAGVSLHEAHDILAGEILSDLGAIVREKIAIAPVG